MEEYSIGHWAMDFPELSKDINRCYQFDALDKPMESLMPTSMNTSKLGARNMAKHTPQSNKNAIGSNCSRRTIPLSLLIKTTFLYKCSMKILMKIPSLSRKPFGNMDLASVLTSMTSSRLLKPAPYRHHVSLQQWKPFKNSIRF